MASENQAIEAGLQTVTLAGQRFVIVPEREYRQLRLGRDEQEPSLPEPDSRGNYPAVESMRVLLARDILRARRAAGLTQVDLARLAGIRAETLNRIEKGKHTPSLDTVQKIDRALKQLEKNSK
ncbi:MAG: helix-turn-helix transcriptional regulator [Pirellulales bacterium]